MNKKVKAQITVYAALSVFLVITLICTAGCDKPGDAADVVDAI